MIICGVKLSHDAAIALVDKGKLIFSIEMEKIANRERHASFDYSYDDFEKLLHQYRYSVEDIDRFAIDGWHPKLHDFTKLYEPKLKLHEYGEMVGKDMLTAVTSSLEKYPKIECKSYLHVSGHAMGSYCTSPFSAKREDAYILIWDGSMFPGLYYYSYQNNQLEGLCNMFPLTTLIYTALATYYDPFDKSDDFHFHKAGKIMAFASLGEVRPSLVNDIVAFIKRAASSFIYNEGIDTCEVTMEKSKKIKQLIDLYPFSIPDILASFQKAISIALIDFLKSGMEKNPRSVKNLCISGGAGLNITWNTDIRNSNLFSSIWVPPFTNDSGNAIGCACCEMVNSSEFRSLSWNVYSGPKLTEGIIPDHWSSCGCTLEEVAKILFFHDLPVLFLNQEAEIGPRALGNRSIIASPRSKAMMHLLNAIKDREYYRPVAPICIEEDAPRFFNPGTPDKYMLFTHYLRNEWKDKIPAVCHVDGTARLQTVNRDDNEIIYDLLTKFKELSGVPVLCNTSANFNGRGFFPNIQSAIEWGKVDLIWNAERMFFRKSTKHIINSNPNTII